MAKSGEAEPLESRFARQSKRDGASGCLLWTGYLDARGYGRITVGSRTSGTHRSVHVHRVAYELANGPIPAGEGHYGTCVRHRCDTPACIEPTHLEIGSQIENIGDMDQRGRRVAVRGEGHGMARLTADDVRSIRARHAEGESQRTLAKVFGCDRSNIALIVKRKKWAHVV